MQRRRTRLPGSRPSSAAATIWPRSSTPAAPRAGRRARCSRTATSLQRARAAPPAGASDPTTLMAAHVLPIFHVHGLFVACHGVLSNGTAMIFHAIRRAPGDRRFAHVDRLHGRADALRAPARAKPALTRAACAPDAPLRIGLGAAAGRHPHAFAAPHRPPHPRALRHERDGDADLQPLRRWASAAAAPSASPLPGVELRVVDDAGARMRARRRSAAIEVRGRNVFAGYWRMPEKTREEFTADGCFRTGDVGAFDADGYVYDRRPQQGPDHQRRLQRLPDGDRGLPSTSSPGSPRVGGRRRAAPGLRRGRRRRRRRQAGRQRGERGAGHRRA